MPKLRYRNDVVLRDVSCGAGAPPPEDEWRERICASAVTTAKRHSDLTTPRERPHSSCRPCSVVLTRCDSLAVALEMRFKTTPVSNGNGSEQSSRPTIENLIEVQRQQQQQQWLLQQQQQHGQSKVLPDVAARELVGTGDLVPRLAAAAAAEAMTKAVVDEKRQLPTAAPVAHQQPPQPATQECLRELSINDVVGSRAHERLRCKTSSAASLPSQSPPYSAVRKRPCPNDEAPTIAATLQLSDSSTTTPKQSRLSVADETGSLPSSPSPKLAARTERDRSSDRAMPTSDRVTARQELLDGASRSAAEAVAVAADDLCDTVNRQRGVQFLEADGHHVPDSPAVASAVVTDQQLTQAPAVAATVALSRQPAGTVAEQCCFVVAAEPNDRFNNSERVITVDAGHCAHLHVTAAAAGKHCSDNDDDDDDDDGEPRLVIDEDVEKSEPSLPFESSRDVTQLGCDGDRLAAAAAGDEHSSSVSIGSHHEKEAAADKTLDSASRLTGGQQHQPLVDIVSARGHGESQRRHQQEEHQHLEQQEVQQLSETELVPIQNQDTSQHHPKRDQRRELEERQQLSGVELALVRNRDNSAHYRQPEEQQQRSVVEPHPDRNHSLGRPDKLLQQGRQQQCAVSTGKRMEHAHSTALDGDGGCGSSKAAGDRSPAVVLPPPELALADSARAPSAESSDRADGAATGSSAERRWSADSGKHRSLSSISRSSGRSDHVAAAATAAVVPGKHRSLSSAARSSESIGHAAAAAAAAAAAPLRAGWPHDDQHSNLSSQHQQQQKPLPASRASYSHGRILPPEDIVLMARTFIMVSHRKPPPFDPVSGALVVEQVEQERPAGSYRFMVKCRAGCEETLSPLGFMEHVEGPSEHRATAASAFGSATMLSYPIEFQDNLLSPVKVRMWNLFCDFFAKHVHPNEDLYIPEPEPTTEPPARPSRRPSAALPAASSAASAAAANAATGLARSATNSALRCADRSISKAPASKTAASSKTSTASSRASPATTDDHDRPAEVPVYAHCPGKAPASSAADECSAAAAAAAATAKPAQTVLSSAPPQLQPTHRRSGVGVLAAVVDRLLQLHVGTTSSSSGSAAATVVAESATCSSAVGQQQAGAEAPARRGCSGDSGSRRRRSRFPAMRSGCDSGDSDSGGDEGSPTATADAIGPLVAPERVVAAVSQHRASAAAPSALGDGNAVAAVPLPPQLQRTAAACRSASSSEELQKWHEALRSLEQKPCSHRSTKAVPTKRPQHQPFETGRRSPAQGLADVERLPTHHDVFATAPVVGSRDNATAHRASPSSETSYGSGSRRINLSSPEGGCSAGSTSPGRPQSAVVNTFRINPKPHIIHDDSGRLAESTTEAATGATLANGSTEGGGHHPCQRPSGIRTTPPPEYRPLQAAENARERGDLAEAVPADSRVATVPTNHSNRRRRSTVTRGDHAQAGIATLPPAPIANGAAASSGAAEQLFRMAAAAAVEMPGSAIGPGNGSIVSSLAYGNPRGDDALARQQGDLLAQNAFLPRDVVADLLRDMWHLYKQSREPPRTTATAIVEQASCSRFSAPHATVHPVQSVAVQPEPRQQIAATAPAAQFGMEQQAPGGATTSSYHQQTRLGQLPFPPVGGAPGASLWYLMGGDQRAAAAATAAAAITTPHPLPSQTGLVPPAGAEAVFLQQTHQQHQHHLATLQQLHYAYHGRPSPPLPPPPPSGIPLHSSHFHHSACQPSPFYYQHTIRPLVPSAIVPSPGYGQQLPDGSLNINSNHLLQQQQSSLQQQQQQSPLQQQQLSPLQQQQQSPLQQQQQSPLQRQQQSPLQRQQQSSLQRQQQASLQLQQQASLQQQPQHDSLPYGMTNVHQMNVGPLSLGLGLQAFHPQLPSGVHLPSRLLTGQSGLDPHASLRQSTFMCSGAALAGDPARGDAGVASVHAAQQLPPVQPQKQMLPPPLPQQQHILQQLSLYQQKSRHHGSHHGNGNAAL